MSGPSALPSEWIRLQTPEGRPYYHCRATGQTTWTPPAAPAAAKGAASPSLPQPHSAPHPAPHPTPHAPVASHHSMQHLVNSARMKVAGDLLFEIERDKLLRITLNARTASFAWIKLGSMVARNGSLKFSRQSVRDQGFGKIMKKALTGEGLTLVKCEGSGVAYCADQGKRVSVIQLSQDRLFLNGNDVLALSSSLTYDIKLMRASAMLSGGLFNVEVSGTGTVAFTCHGGVYVLEATQQNPVYTDPNATVAWTHMPTLRTDLSVRSFLGRGSGEEFQLAFNHGFVIVQPYEERSPLAYQNQNM